VTAQVTNLAHASGLLRTIPRFTEDASRLALELYRQLAQGEPVALDALADVHGSTADEVRALLADEQLKAWVFYDDENRVIGFRGLAVAPMPHRFEVDGRNLFTWCAVDSLFIPPLLGRPARIESRDPRTGRTIRLTVTPDGVESVDPASTVMSYVAGDPEVRRTNPAKVMATFCHHIYYLESPTIGAEWAAEHGHGAFIVSLAEAFELGSLFNATQFG
jgi:alkylmercury lyase